VDSLSSLIGAFADYARSGGTRREPVNINALAEETVELFHDRLDGVRVTLALAPDLSPVLADAGRLRQVMNNLVINAHHAVTGRSDPAIEIATRVVVENGKEGVELTVSDNGPGFAPDMIARAFDPYVSTRERGSGLGLAIVRRIVEEHEGHISAENREGGGARMQLWLPAQRVAQPARESRA
jgi:signal transduction histidine kinase